MLVTGLVPAVLAPAVEGLLGAVTGLRAVGEVDVAGLYFGDFSWLEVGDDRRTRMWMQGKRLDVIRKSVIEIGADDSQTSSSRGGSGGAVVARGKDNVGGQGGGGGGGEKRGGKKLKRCTRCCAVTEDVQGREKGIWGNMAVVQLQRTCLCGGWWMMV